MKSKAARLASYRHAVQWIALNDNPGDDEAPEVLRQYTTVALIADLFNTTAVEVAASVFYARHPDAK